MTDSEDIIAAWRESGVVAGREWNTAVDELVCPICGPLHGKFAPYGEPFEGGYDSPPAHPRCRCWISAVSKADLERDIADYEYVEGGGFVERQPMEAPPPEPEVTDQPAWWQFWRR